MSLEVVRVEGKPVSVRLSGYEFPCEGETGQTIVPKMFLTGFRLSEIPNDITIKPVESIEGHVIHVEHDIGMSQFIEGLSSTVAVILKVCLGCLFPVINRLRVPALRNHHR